MRRCFLLPCVILLLTGCATGPIIQETPPERIVPLSHLSRLDVLTRLNAYVFVIEPGTALALDVAVESDLLGLSDPEKRLHVVIKRKLYARFQIPEDLSPGDLSDLLGLSGKAPERDAKRQRFMKDFRVYLSTDGVRWAALGDTKTLREVLGLRQVDLSLGLGLDLKEGIKANLVLKALP